LLAQRLEKKREGKGRSNMLVDYSIECVFA
jgi:hypothetical protein